MQPTSTVEPSNSMVLSTFGFHSLTLYLISLLTRITTLPEFIMSDNVNESWVLPVTAKATTDSSWDENGGIQAASGDTDGADGPFDSTGDAGCDAGDNACFSCGKPG